MWAEMEIPRYVRNGQMPKDGSGNSTRKSRPPANKISLLPVDSSHRVRVVVGRRRRKYRDVRAGGETGHWSLRVSALWAVHPCEKNLISAEAFKAARRHALVFSVKSTLHRSQRAAASVLGMAETRR